MREAAHSTAADGLDCHQYNDSIDSIKSLSLLLLLLLQLAEHYRDSHSHQASRWKEERKEEEGTVIKLDCAACARVGD